MKLSLPHGPFVTVIDMLVQSECHYIFAGSFYPDGKRHVVRHSGGDLISAILLLGLSFDYPHVFSRFNIQPADKEEIHKFAQAGLSIDVENELSKINDSEFALLWTPSMEWSPTLANSDGWDDRDVRTELFQTAISGLGHILNTSRGDQIWSTKSVRDGKVTYRQLDVGDSGLASRLAKLFRGDEADIPDNA